MVSRAGLECSPSRCSSADPETGATAKPTAGTISASTMVIRISAKARLMPRVDDSNTTCLRFADSIAYVAGEDPLRVRRLRMIRPVHRLEDPVGARADGVGMSARDAR